jgi:hypothetical protein
MKIENEFQKWASGFSGCDGGDIGSPQNRSIWVCGIEWGGSGHDPASLKEIILKSVDSPPYGYEYHSENLAYIFNWQTLKLLTAIQGESVENYIQASEKTRPFVKDSKGFFKMNLFPVAFKDTSNQRWISDFITITGFQNKEEYLTWCRQVRFLNLKSWVEKFKPKLIICFGKSFLADFESAFVNGSSEFTKETILNRELSWTRTQDETLIVICPFPVNRYGLNSHVLLQAFGERIRELMNNN